MMRREELSFFGYGKTTRAIARLFGGGFDFYDDNTAESFTDTEGNRIHPSREYDPQKSSMEILTPGIRPDSPLLKRARNPVSEYDLFLDPSYRKLFELFAPGYPADETPFTIWISGTNGKTTTTQMLTYLLEERGAVSGGNIGTPLAQLDPRSPIWVLETSSYTLHHTKKASPGIYLLLPITPDHLGWHGSAEAYERDKLSVVERMREGELALIPSGVTLPKTEAWVVEYEDVESLESYFSIDGKKTRYKAAFLLDATLALSVEKVLFDRAGYDRIDSFTIDRHRQEEIVDKMGRLWVNDSKATNIDATLQALEAYHGREIHILLGGDGKGVDMTPLIEKLSTMDSPTIYAMGSNGEEIARIATDYGLEVYEYGHMDDALPDISSKMGDDGVALLSPASASLDQFSSYEERGDRFVEFVRNLS